MKAGRALVVAYVEALEARDWDGLGDLLAPGVVYEVPQTRERVSGREAVVRFNREYPGEWHLRVREAYGDASGGAVHIGWVGAPGEEESGAVALLRFDSDGRIRHITDYWPEPYEPPAERAHLVERF
jgi:hypothetical protein